MARRFCPVLAATQLELRDGATWVSGLCPFCWERVAFPASREGSATTVQCPCGHHPLRILALRSAGDRQTEARQARMRATVWPLILEPRIEDGFKIRAPETEKIDERDWGEERRPLETEFKTEAATRAATSTRFRFADSL